MEKIDVRVIRTKQKLFAAYVALLQDEQSDTITIQALTSRANINRVTFYKHFKNSATFHNQFIDYYILQLYEFLKPLNYKTYEKGFEYEALLKLLQHIKEHQKVYRVLFTSQNILDYNKKLLTYFQSRIKKHTEELAKFDFPGTSVNQEIVAWYGASALLGTIIMWAHANFNHSPGSLATSIIRLTPYQQ